MNTKIVKAVTKDIQRINISYEEALEVKKNRVLMYNLDYAIALANQMKKIDFEGSIAELENIVRRLESGELSLDESIDAFERAVALVKECNTKLDKAEQRVRILTESEDGSVTDAPFETDDAT